MNQRKPFAGLDAGHLHTKAVIMRGSEVLGRSTAPTGYDVVSAAKEAIEKAAGHSGISCAELGGIVSTGIFRDVVKEAGLNVIAAVPDYMADAKGALFLNRNARTVIDIGGNIHKAITFDGRGDLVDVIQNDKCADGMGIFYTNMARRFGLNDEEMSEMALRSTGHLSLAIQCSLSAESDALDWMCQGKDIADISDAVIRFIVERVADMCNAMNLNREIVAAGGLARSGALINHLSRLINQEVRASSLPEYVGAIGAVVSKGGGE